MLGPYPSASHARKAPSAAALETEPPLFHDHGILEATLAPGSGEPPGGKSWTLVSASEGPLDLRAALHARESDLVAYAAGTLHVEQAGHYLLLVGADDGLRVFVDGKGASSRARSRARSAMTTTSSRSTSRPATTPCS